MPAIITHHLFGEDASRSLPDDITLDAEELLAFLLGNQGADPLYFCFTATPVSIQTCHRLAAALHRDHVVEALIAARDAVAFLPRDDQGIGRAFSLGFAAHYLLDSEAHAFILAQENAICEAEPSLTDSHPQVHALIESELDSWMLWSTRKQTIDDAPAHADLTRTKRVSRVAGTILSQVAGQVFDTNLVPDRYEGCLRDYELVYQAIDPTGNPRGRMIVGAERLGQRHSLLDALSHSNEPSDGCAAANLSCHPWTDPLTGEEHTTSFADVFYDTLEAWPAFAQTYLHGNKEQLSDLLHRGYDGRALDADRA